MPITRRPATPCPVCHGTLDAHGDVPGDLAPRPPAAGDMTVCAYCAAILVFTDGAALRLLTAAEAAALPPDDEVFRVQRFFQRHAAERN